MATVDLNTDLIYPHFWFGTKDTHSTDQFSDLLPQMPKHQLQLFIEQAIACDYLVVIQLNSESFQKRFLEVIGFLSYVPDSQKIRIHPYDQKDRVLFHVDLKDIRHIRRYP